MNLQSNPRLPEESNSGYTTPVGSPPIKRKLPTEPRPPQLTREQMSNQEGQTPTATQPSVRRWPHTPHPTSTPLGQTNSNPPSQPPQFYPSIDDTYPPLVHHLLTALDQRYRIPRQTTPMKPKEVEMLKLAELHGIGTSVRLKRFFEQVESCSEEDKNRITIAKSRIENEIAILLTSKIQEELTPITWAKIKSILSKQFNTSLDISRAWMEIDEAKYSVDTHPQAFVNKMQCRLHELRLAFPHQHLPPPDRLIKRKLQEGLREISSRNLEDFFDEGVPLSQFVEIVERERHNAISSGNLVRRRQLMVKGIPTTGQTQENPEMSEVESLRAQLQVLMDQIKRLSTGKSRYCTYCRTDSHYLRECPQNPPRGCFDCSRPLSQCRRGAPGCPGLNQNA